MRLLVDQRFLDEARRFELRCTCRVCVYFAPESEGCSEGFPNGEHLTRPEDVGQQICFCKKFELL